MVYDKPFVIIVDALSVSSAEEFAGAMKSIGRATVVGEQTPGLVVTVNIEQLQNGAVFMYPLAETMTHDGTVLEGRGVIPDVKAILDRLSLYRGVDPQLEAAISVLRQKL